MGIVIPLSTKKTDLIAPSDHGSSLSRAVRNLEGTLSEQADAVAEFKKTISRVNEAVQRIEKNYIIFERALEKVNGNTQRLRGKSLRLRMIMEDSLSQNQCLQSA